MAERETDRSPYARPGFVVSAVLLGMLVLAALFITIGAATRHRGSRVAAIGDSTTARAAVKAVKASGCSLPAGSDRVPTVPPTMGWVTVGQMTAPQAPASFGPQRTQDGIGVCFAHNPTGSLVAAINFFAQATVADPMTLLRTLAAATPARHAASVQARDGGDELLQDSDGDPGSVQVTGYQVVDYTPSLANVNIVLEGPGGELASVECQLDWQAGDWKFVIPAGGQLDSAAITSMDGFVSWEAIPGQVASSSDGGVG
jgi:4-amino-4-deoxy-L-arabinose transferase-like glycosyltransferase